MNDAFVEQVDHAAILVRKGSLRTLGASPLVEALAPLIQKHLTSPIDECSAVLIGDALARVFAEAIAALQPEHAGGDTPDHRNFIYLNEYILKGREWKSVSDELSVSRSTFYDVKQTAAEKLALLLWHRKEEADMSKKILNNLRRPTYTTFTEVYDEHGKRYTDEVVIPMLRSYRGWTVTLVGEPGVGKSSIAYAVAERIVSHPNLYNLPFEAVIWLSCRQDIFQPEANKTLIVSMMDSMSRVYEEIGRTLENLEVYQNALEEKRILVEKLMRERACLLVVDNLDSEWTPPEFQAGLEAFVRGLERPHMSLVTMRPEKAMFEGAMQIKITPMRKQVAHDFLETVAEDRGIPPFSEAEFEQVYEKTHGVPLAGKSVLGLTRVHRYSLAEALDFGEYNRKVLEFMFEKAYQRLPAAAVKILSVMPLFGDTATSEALEYAADINGPDRVDAIGRLYRGYMIERTSANGSQEPAYTLLPFFREFLRKQRADPQTTAPGSPFGPDFLLSASLRIADYYYKLLNAGKDRRENGLLLLKAEKQNIFNAMRWCWESDNPRFVDILELIGPQMGTLRLQDERRKWGERAAQLLTQLGRDCDAQWCRIRDVAWSMVSKGTPESRRAGCAILEQELPLAEQNSWPRNKALIMRNLAKLATEEGNLVEAERYLAESIRVWEESQDEFWKIISLHRLADNKVKQGLFVEAIDLYTHVETEYQKRADNEGAIEAMSSRAYALTRLERRDQGGALIAAAVVQARAIPAPAYIYALAMRVSAEINALLARFAQAEKDAHEARDVYDALGMSYHVDRLDEWIIGLHSGQIGPSAVPV